MPYDVLVIGGGPAGLSAAINIRQRGKSVLVVRNPITGNPLWKSNKINNYLGMPNVTGEQLLSTFQAHAEAMDVSFMDGKVLNTTYAGGTWYASIGTDVQEESAIVLTGGVVRNKKFPGEDTFLGRGVSHCATCDGMLYKGKTVAVLGYYDVAKEEADFLTEIGCKVEYFDKPKDCEILGENKVNGVKVEGETHPVDGVFVLRPTAAPTDLFPGLETDNGYVKVNRDMATNLPGLFAAGDCTGGPLQISKATGEGLVAGQKACMFIDQLARSQK